MFNIKLCINIIFILYLNKASSQKFGKENLSHIRNIMLSNFNKNYNISNWPKIYEENFDFSQNCSQVENPIIEEQKICDLEQNSWFSWFRKCEKKQQLLRDSEERFLNYMNISYKQDYINIGCLNTEETSYISTISAGVESNLIPLVLLHGYGAGVAYWALNIGVLAKHRPVYAIDIIGFARSSRTKLSTDPIEAERQIIESIELWRRKMKLNQMILVGHSYGGFLTTSYAIKYPKRVAHLILADPWGFSKRPVTLSKNNTLPIWAKALSKVIRPISPLGIVRSAGYLGPSLINRIRPDLAKRFMPMVEDYEDVIPNYAYYSVALQPPTGEDAFTALMAGFAWAKYPMILRMKKLDEKVPITFIFGDKTWVDISIGYKSQQIRKKSYVNIEILDDAGHHVYADAYEEFNRIILNIAIMAEINQYPEIRNGSYNFKNESFISKFIHVHQKYTQS